MMDASDHTVLPKAYDPSSAEDRLYALWEQSGAFRADASSQKEPFSIALPPPNATGQLHLGHAVMLALQDIFVRVARMQGKEALWVPGTDHAAIATENVVIKRLQKEGMRDPRMTLGREKLVEEIARFVVESRGTIRAQIRKMGSSCDWSRERYTMDPMLSRCVNEVFAAMYEDGLIYRGHRIVNWDPKLQTTVSDDEITRTEEQASFYTFRYGPFEIATARPETKFGDKYVVMHPEDERYHAYQHGETFECEWINGPVRATIIKDAAVDPSFGTGVMTITPWHDAVDFEIAERHGLEKEQVIDEHGRLLPIAEEFAGMHIDDARPKIVEKLESKGLLVKVDTSYVHSKALNSRGGGVIEPQIKLQWFIDVNKKVVQWKGQTMSLKEVLHDTVHHGDIRIIPERFEKTYFAWIDNLRDWCISRQIWWGHRVPVWYREDEVVASVRAPEGEGWQQDNDTLDTWFSSALWTWSTLADPSFAEDFTLSLGDILKRSPDVAKFHPTQVMETGYDIIFFWVARMILMTTYTFSRYQIGASERERIPFQTVYLHGLVRTRDGRKMSKSDPETMIDPLDMIARYGTDALRLSMIVGQTPGSDSRLYEEKIAGYRNFINKLWNASRFVLMQCQAADVSPADVPLAMPIQTDQLSLADRALLHELHELSTGVTESIAAFRLSEAGERLYSFVWDFFCDWYLELSKGEANVPVLLYALRSILILLHPYCPFVTEEIWSRVSPADAGLLLQQKWDTALPHASFPQDRAAFQTVVDVITAIRKLRADQGVEPSLRVPIVVHTSDVELLRAQSAHIERIAKLSQCTILEPGSAPKESAAIFLPQTAVYLPLAGLVDPAKERESLLKERANLEKFIAGLQAKLSNEQFMARAPQEVVEEQRSKCREAQEKLAKMDERLASLA